MVVLEAVVFVVVVGALLVCGGYYMYRCILRRWKAMRYGEVVPTL
jgi:hypothetical protein